MIVSFRDRETERFWSGERSRRLPPWIQSAAMRKLSWLYQAASLRELAVPRGNRLESLRGRRKEQCSIRINEQWRVCFRWIDGDAHDVEIVDYH